jgi:hypothetical protein
MRSPILVSVMAAVMSASSVAALAQPGPGGDPRHDQAGYGPRADMQQRGASRYARQAPPPGWDQQTWRYRQQYERRHPDQRRDWHRKDDNSGAAVVAGILGFVLGAAIAGSQQDQERAHTKLSDKEWVSYCARKYRSFDANSGTYFGNDGLRHYCK